MLRGGVACLQGPVFLRVQSYPCSRQESRALSFSEEKTHWQLPMSDVNIVCDVATKDGTSSAPTVPAALQGFGINQGTGHSQEARMVGIISLRCPVKVVVQECFFIRLFKETVQDQNRNLEKGRDQSVPRGSSD